MTIKSAVNNRRNLLRVRTGPDGIHLFNPVSGEHLLLDEVRLPESAWSRSPRSVSIALTNACDLRCQYCYAPKRGARLTLEQVCGWAKELDSNGCLGLGFGGGEPTLHPHFGSLIHAISQETGMAITFTTHAHHFDSKLATVVQGRVSFIRVSVDGVENTYEALRGRPFRSLRERVRRIRDVVRFGINTVVNEQTIGELTRVAQFAEEAGAEELLLLPQRTTSWVSALRAETVVIMDEWIRSYRGKLRLAVGLTETLRPLACDPTPNDSGLLGYVHIDARGWVRPTSFSPQGIPISPAGVMVAIEQLRRC